ncbi:hypothetical protein [Coralliovum pocilloporae]|uniref:hypothetical protein n=1 Tax=Coralliovum pocilloporae TaxID=3066369 RepID=UPI0033069E7C
MSITATPSDIGAQKSVLSLERLTIVLIAGAFGTIAFEIFGQAISPLLGGSRLAPVPLAASVFKAIAGFGSKPAAYMLHYLAGVLCYPLAFALIGRPLWKSIAPSVPWYVVAVAFGLFQWVFALYVMAHVIAGMPPFLNFAGITWAALYGHVIYALVAIGVSQHLSISWGRKT